ncbi:serine/threonine-protein kinase [Kitasatospora sp. NPDC057904]|uniref:serine/threonine-protein kinase n=1 Tax=unclassified Kitasatospora TaxID=2633591 RepID=UPI0036DBF710
MTSEEGRSVGPGAIVAGRYRLAKRLGAGGFGRVWQAHDLVLRVDVAIKEVWLAPSMSGAEQGERIKRAEREARSAARLRDHPHVVAVHDVVVDGGTPWMVMQLVSGRSLADRLDAEGPLSVQEAARVAAGVLSALGAAHAWQIVHRDVKPANIMLTDDGQVLLTDFGIAVDSQDTALTATGAFIGSAEYMAPERLQGGPDAPEGDLFSLGVTLYQAVEGVSPFRRASAASTLLAVVSEDAPVSGAAGALTSLIVGLMAKDPARRPTIDEATRMLGGPHPVPSAADGPDDGPPLPARPGPVAAGRTRTTRRWPALTATTLAVGLAVGGMVVAASLPPDGSSDAGRSATASTATSPPASSPTPTPAASASRRFNLQPYLLDRTDMPAFTVTTTSGFADLPYATPATGPWSCAPRNREVPWERRTSANAVAFSPDGNGSNKWSLGYVVMEVGEQVAAQHLAAVREELQQCSAFAFTWLPGSSGPHTCTVSITPRPAPAVSYAGGNVVARRETYNCHDSRTTYATAWSDKVTVTRNGFLVEFFTENDDPFPDEPRLSDMMNAALAKLP